MRCNACCHYAGGLCQKDEVITEMKFKELIEDKTKSDLIEKPRHFDLSQYKVYVGDSQLLQSSSDQALNLKQSTATEKSRKGR